MRWRELTSCPDSKHYGGILADEMGYVARLAFEIVLIAFPSLGKTVQAIALMAVNLSCVLPVPPERC